MHNVPRLALFSILALAALPLATAWARRPIPLARVDLDVLVDGVPQAKHGQGGSYFLPVREIGCEYVLRIRNRHHKRIEAVISVDGLSVINGQRAASSIRGYLVGAGETVDIPGWRKGESRVAAFTFSREEDSYAYRTGRPNGIGVIQLLAFEERSPHVYRGDERPLLKRRGGADDSRNGADGGSGAGREKSAGREGIAGGEASDAPQFAKASGTTGRPIHRERIGTSYGRELGHEVSRVPFVRSGVMHRVTIHYGGRGHVRPLPHRIDGDFVPPPPSR